MATPFPAYRGDEDFVFICYSHQDSATVYQEIQRLHEAGVKIWYDEGIRPGSEWTDELANAIRTCKTVLFFATPHAIGSKHCRDEIQYARRFDKSVIVVYLQPTQLPPGLDLTLGSLHAVEKGHHDEARYFELLLEAINAPPGLPDLPAPASAASRRSNRKTYGVIAAVATIIIATAAAVSQFSGERETKSPALAERNSVALLPFENRGGFDADSYYPESLSEDLLNRLVAIDGLKVASRRASFAYRTVHSNNLVDVAAALGVSAVIVGYIRRADDLIRLSLELVDVSSGAEIVLWSNSYDNRPMQQMLAIQSDVTNQIAQAFFPDGLSRATEERLARVSTKSPEAYSYYLEARDLLRRPMSGSTNLEDAAELFVKAIELDGEYAWARAGLCGAHRLAYVRREGTFERARTSCEGLIDYQEDLFDVRLSLGQYYETIGEIERAMAELEKAVRLNPNSADAKLELANVYADRFALHKNELDRVRAEQAYLEAISTEPNHWYTYHSYATFLTWQLRFEDAKEQLRQALSLEPDSIASLNNLAGVLYRQGLTDEAEQHWQRSLEISDDNRWAYTGLGILYHYDRNFDKAANALRRAAEIMPDDHTVWGRLGESYRLIPDKEADARIAFQRAVELAEADARINPNDWEVHGFLSLYYAYLGNFERADASLDNMFRLNSIDDPMTHYYAALVAYEQDDIEETFNQLENAMTRGFSQQQRFIKEEPALAELRREHAQRFQTLMERF